MNQSLAIATGTRAEFGIFRPLLREFGRRGWPFQLYVTGSHLSPHHGLTRREIESDGFTIDETVDILLASDSPPAVCKSFGLAVAGFADVLTRRRPDLLFLLGDRYEALAIATAAQIVGVPIAHIHGGEVTEGAMDDAFRHAITKLSRLHFVSSQVHRRRVIQLGEKAENVFDVGALGLDNLALVDRIDKRDLEQELDFSFRDFNIVVTQHPLTLDPARSMRDLSALLEALREFQELGMILMAPNADPGGNAILDLLEDFAAEDPRHRRLVTSLGTARYFSLLYCVDAVVGNSSSGLIEVPSFGIPTVNVGDRQKGRLAGSSVIHAPGDRTAIVAAVKQALARPRGVPPHENPYGDGRTATRICDVISARAGTIDFVKSFHDLP